MTHPTSDKITAGRSRVNSLRRLRHAQAIGCQSVDGTYLAYGPDRNLPKLLRWLAELHQPSQGPRPPPPSRAPAGRTPADGGT